MSLKALIAGPRLRVALARIKAAASALSQPVSALQVDSSATATASTIVGTAYQSKQNVSCLAVSISSKGGCYAKRRVYNYIRQFPPFMFLQAGKLGVSFFNLPPFGQYWIIRLDGSSSSGYDTALVYSCALGTKTLYILSRSPVMSDLQIASYLQWAETKGIVLPSYNPFIKTYNSVLDCSSFWSSG